MYFCIMHYVHRAENYVLRGFSGKNYLWNPLSVFSTILTTTGNCRFLDFYHIPIKVYLYGTHNAITNLYITTTV
jgi:hypothetical protein